MRVNLWSILDPKRQLDNGFCRENFCRQFKRYFKRQFQNYREFAGKNGNFFTMLTIKANYSTSFIYTYCYQIFQNITFLAQMYLKMIKSDQNYAKNSPNCQKLLKISFTDFCPQFWQICRQFLALPAKSPCLETLLNVDFMSGNLMLIKFSAPYNNAYDLKNAYKCCLTMFF